jgi:hypothetical protein
LLFHPHHGYRFLSDTQVGWILTRQTMRVPRPPSAFPSGVKVDGLKYKVSESYEAQTDFVLGEFYWKVAVGERASCVEYGAGSGVLAAEVMDDEFNWSIGSKISAKEIWSAFKLPGEPLTGGEADVKLPEGCVVLGIVLLILLIYLLVKFGPITGSGSSSSRSFFGGK